MCLAFIFDEPELQVEIDQQRDQLPEDNEAVADDLPCCASASKCPHRALLRQRIELRLARHTCWANAAPSRLCWPPDQLQICRCTAVLTAKADIQTSGPRGGRTSMTHWIIHLDEVFKPPIHLIARGTERCSLPAGFTWNQWQP